MLCNVTGVMTLPDGKPATGVRFQLIPSVGGVVSVGDDTVAQIGTHFRVGQGGAVDFSAQSGEYVMRSVCGRLNDTVVYIPDQESVDINSISPVMVPRRNRRLVIKRGDSLEVGCIWVNPYDVRQSLDGVAIAASMQGPDGDMVDLDVWVANSTDSGEFTVGLGPNETSYLVEGYHRVTVRFTRDSGASASSMSFKVYVAGDFE